MIQKSRRKSKKSIFGQARWARKAYLYIDSIFCSWNKNYISINKLQALKGQK